ncbi:hypothetical protein FRB96_000550 [Tulasnella sp. 330]|nr:hypothetical protein FRB96_000550 [Tulasnella sp. 330]
MFNTSAVVNSVQDDTWLNGQAYQQPTHISSSNTMTTSRQSTTTTYPLANQAVRQHADTMRKQQWVANMQAPTTPQEPERKYPSHAKTSDNLHNPASSHYEFSPTLYHSSERSPVIAEGGYRSSGSDESASGYDHRVTWPDSSSVRNRQPMSMPSAYDDALYGAAIYSHDSSPSGYNVSRAQVNLSSETHQRLDTFEGRHHVASSHPHSSGQPWHQSTSYGATGHKMASSPSDHSYPSSPDSPHHTPGVVGLSACSSTASLRSSDYSPLDSRYEYQSSVGSTSPSVTQACPRYPHDIRRKKVEMACHFCRARKLKCDGEHPTCTQCDRRGQDCTWDIAVRRRGPGQKKNEKEEKLIDRQTKKAGAQRRSVGRANSSQEPRVRGGSSGDESSDDFGRQSNFPNIGSQSVIALRQQEPAPISPSDFADYPHNQSGQQHYSTFQGHSAHPTIIKAEDEYEADATWGSSVSYPAYSSYDRTTAGGGHQAGLGYGQSVSSFPYAMQQVSDWTNSRTYSSTPSSLMGAMKDPLQHTQRDGEPERQSWRVNVGGSQDLALQSNLTEQQAAENWLLEQCS